MAARDVSFYRWDPITPIRTHREYPAYILDPLQRFFHWPPFFIHLRNVDQAFLNSEFDVLDVERSRHSVPRHLDVVDQPRSVTLIHVAQVRLNLIV